MEKKHLENSEVIEYWLQSSTEDYKTMEALLIAKRYSWSLFLGHLVIEKLLKAYFVKNNSDYPPRLHNLLRLAVESKLSITEELKQKLITISAFNINARYDDYKNTFQKKCTPEFTSVWTEVIRELRLWMIEQIKK